MEQPTSIRIDMEEGLATVALAQGGRGNPIDAVFAREFRDAVGRLHDTPALRAVLLQGDGPNFSVGGDLKSFHPQRDALPALVRSLTADFHMALQRLWHLPVPVVAAVQGYAMGGAASLAAGADVVVAAESAKLGSAFAQIGFSCDSGSSWSFTSRMGPARAKRFVLLAEMLTAREALDAGLVDRVVADASLADESLALARRLAAGPTRAYAEIKRLFMRAGSAQLEAQLEDEAHTLAGIATTDDAREGVTAMVERRQPRFAGR